MFSSFNFYNKPPQSLPQTLSNLHLNPFVTNLANKFGLVIQTVSWEDTARSKNSSWGPNISDMTLCVDNYNMSMIRKPNYGDITCDMPIEKFFLTVGNETKKGNLERISLKEYLQNIGKYTNHKVQPMFDTTRDTKILTSAQCCILPADKDGSVEFNARLFNYQSYSDNPAVLVIVVSANGTSAQVVTEYQQKLYFNEGEMAANFVAKGLTQHRLIQGITDEKALKETMNLEEKEQNSLLIFQIPLKQKVVKRNYDSMCLESCSMAMPPGCASASSNFSAMSMKSANFEDAIISTGKAHSKFIGTGDFALERDTRYPIRCTIQMYKISNTNDISEQQFSEIAEKINNIYNKSDVYGSLVVDGMTNRITEPVLPPHTVIPEIVIKRLSKDERTTKPLTTFL